MVIGIHFSKTMFPGVFVHFYFAKSLGVSYLFLINIGTWVFAYTFFTCAKNGDNFLSIHEKSGFPIFFRESRTNLDSLYDLRLDPQGIFLSAIYFLT